MVYTKRNTRRKTRRKYKPKDSGYGYKPVNVSRGVAVGLPKMFKIKHRYVETSQMSSNSGALTPRQFSCNGIWDPNVTGSGHQPHYFDQMAALYNHYTVVGSRARFTVTSLNPTEDPLQVAVIINDDTVVTPTTMNGIIEQGSSRAIMLSANNNKTHTFTKTWSMKKSFGVGGTLANSLLRGSGDANPTEQQYFSVLLQATDGLSTVQIILKTEIEYIVIWNELKDIVGS